MNGQHLFCFGLGYSAQALARRLVAAGWRVTGTCRSAERQAQLREDGFSATLFDRDRPIDAGALDGVTHLLISVPPDVVGDPVLAMHRRDIAAMNRLGLCRPAVIVGNGTGADPEQQKFFRYVQHLTPAQMDAWAPHKRRSSLPNPARRRIICSGCWPTARTPKA